MKLQVGTFTTGDAVRIDLDSFLETRALIQANSGGGKSYLIRRTIEVLVGHVQQIIIDTEGEFASLREKYDFVIAAAAGGDAIAHPKTASLLARRLLETRVSAILDISELKAAQRDQFVRGFIEGLMDAPRALWGPLVVVLDEAHVYCPEKGQGEAESTDAVIDLASRGRKRGFCLLAATQRSSKFHKSAAAELLNKFVGRTGLDVDVKRASFDLGMTPKDAQSQLVNLNAGEFFVFGPAISKTVSQMKVDQVETAHPKSGHRSGKRALVLPKPTDAIRAVLPQLADLQAEQEQKAKTEEDLRRELAQAKRDLTAAQRQQPKVAAAPSGPDRRTVARLARLTALIEELMKFIVTITATDFAAKAGESIDGDALQAAIAAAVTKAKGLIEAGQAKRNGELVAIQREAAKLVSRTQKMLEQQDVTIAVEVKHNEPHTVAARETRPTVTRPERVPSIGEGRGDLQPVQARILDALAEAEQLSADSPDRTLVALLSGYSNIKSTGFVKALGSLSTAGLITYPTSGLIALTEAGREVASAPDQPTTADELQARVIKLIGGAASKVLQPLIDAGREPISRQDLAEASGYGNIKSTGFVKTLGRLRTLGFIDYQPNSMVVAQPVLFLEG